MHFILFENDIHHNSIHRMILKSTRHTRHTQNININRTHMMMAAANQGNVNEKLNKIATVVNMIDIKVVRNIAKRIDIIDLGMEEMCCFLIKISFELT